MSKGGNQNMFDSAMAVEAMGKFLRDNNYWIDYSLHQQMNKRLTTLIVRWSLSKIIEVMIKYF